MQSNNLIRYMKRLFLLGLAVAMLIACGNRTAGNTAGSDSTMQGDGEHQSSDIVSADVSGADLQLAVEAQLQAVYAKLREMDTTDDGINIRQLDKLFCSEEFNRLEGEVFEKSGKATNPEESFSDEGWRWFPGIGVAEKVDSVTVEFIQKGRIETKFRLTDKQGRKARQYLVMLLENGQWKIHNWIDAEAFPEGNYLDWMKRYLGIQEGEVMVAPEEDWTEEAVEKAIKGYYDAVNKTFAQGSKLSPFDLDKQYYTAYWNEVYDKVNKKDEQQTSTENCFFIDDAHWSCGLETPLVVESVKVELTTGDTAEAIVKLKEKETGMSQKVILSMEYEKGQWRIHDILGKSHDPSDSMLTKMEKYIK